MSLDLSYFFRNNSVSSGVRPENKRLADNDKQWIEGPSRNAKELRFSSPPRDVPRRGTLPEECSPGSSVACDEDVKINESDKCLDSDDVDLNIYHVYKSQCTTDISSSNRRKQKSKDDVLTALEKQVLGLKRQHSGIVLMIQNGYKYHFYEEDAEIASKLLEIVTFRQHSFLQACVPVARLKYYVYKFTEKGYKVGVVNQTETSTLKAAGENRNAPLSRELSFVYSRATLIGDDVSPETVEGNSFTGGRKLTCILSVCEDNTTTEATVGIAAFDPSTGEGVYDSFHDTKMREELEKRVAHLNPAEVLAPKTLSLNTETLLKHSGVPSERIPDEEFEFSKALAAVAIFLNGPETGPVLDDLAPVTVRALGALVHYLAQFRLADGLTAARFTNFTSQEMHLQLTASALQNLEVFVTSSGDERGSLLSVMDCTRTAFGRRLLEHWLSQPLRDLPQLCRRQEAVQELMDPQCSAATLLTDILRGLTDLERGLTIVAYRRCSTNTFHRVVETLNYVCQGFETVAAFADTHVRSPLLRELIRNVTVQLSGTNRTLDIINPSAAAMGDKTSILNDYSEFPNVLGAKVDLEAQEGELNDMRLAIAQVLGVSSFDYSTVAGQEYLIQVKKDVEVPPDWPLISQTKIYRRYRSPEVARAWKQLCRLRERVEAQCEGAWRKVVDTFNEDYIKHKTAVRCLATLDVLLSFSEAAKKSDYCRPHLIVSEESVIFIEKGRHPVLSKIMEESGQFIPNDTHLKSSEPVILSGPNTGGKSCYIRQVALLVIMAHTGSFVPADSATLSILDAVHVRMGARDDIIRRKSTFMVETEGTANILHRATSRSLVLMDEFGRGTGTHDGAALAVAVLSHLVQKVHCLLLFVTHYPEVMQTAPNSNYHMGYHIVNDDRDAEGKLIFLYTLTKGAASGSYGLDVARRAGVPGPLTMAAKDFADRMKARRWIMRKVASLLRTVWTGSKMQVNDALNRLARIDLL